MVDNLMSGYNGTIFAYGQSGSGKTYTVFGLAPRALEHIFKKIREEVG